jgi:hypothetical protein
MSEAIDKRNFFLSLSVIEGQRLAHFAGFSLPSEEVQQSEVLDVINKHLILSASGMLEIIKECVEWTLSITDSELTAEERVRTKEIMAAYSVALLSRLLDSNAVHIDPDLLESPKGDVQGFIRGLFKAAIEDYDE